ncbi:hypothetical protein MNBD_CHLOROFLEXI01-1459 [hydrothermal vent metagenome]|uniref:Uncharacterized protein n=1 Tax=hydrothermal vent metagenome TaxID=652676 RepID=A0A3B0VTY2_9ZZZZ
MKITNLIDLQDSRQLRRMVWLALAAVLIVAASFGGYYYWDRYIYLDDRSPLEIGVEHLEEMVRQNPQDPQTRVALAQYYFENGVYEKAIAQSEQVLAAFPDNDNALFVLGMSYIQSGQTEAAFEPLLQFADIRRESSMPRTDTVLETALYFLGQSYVETNQPDKAVEVLTEALLINAADADAMYQLGLAYTLQGQHEEAIGQYAEAVRFVPDFIEAYGGMITSYSALDWVDYVAYARGMEAFSLKDYETARTHLDVAATNLPEFAPAFVGLGLVQEQLGDLQGAQANFEYVLELDSGNFMATHALGRVQLKLDEQE